MEEKIHKLGVIVPQRRRLSHLEIFKEKITKYLNEKEIDFELIIINQDEAKKFNRGMLLNIGFKWFGWLVFVLLRLIGFVIGVACVDVVVFVFVVIVSL
jgi:hypothetical protein